MRQFDSMRFPICPLALVAVLLLSGQAHGQNEPVKSLQKVDIALWPEYDKPSVLVMYRVEIPAETAFPATLQLSLPAAVGEPHAVAWRGPDGKLFLAQYTRQVRGEWATLEIKAPGPKLQIEYYDLLPISGQARDYRFSWSGGVAVKEFAFEVQEPTGASDFTIKPTPTHQSALGERSLRTYRNVLGSLESTAKATIELHYKRNTLLPSVAPIQSGAPGPAKPGMAAFPEGPTTELPPSQDSSGAIPTWVIIFGFLVLAGALLFVLTGNDESSAGAGSKTETE